MNEEGLLTFWEHTAQLRLTFIKILLTIIFGFIAAFFFYDSLFKFLISPLPQIKKERYDSKLLETQILNQERILNRGPGVLIYRLNEEKEALTPLATGVIALENREYSIPEGKYLDFRGPSEIKLLILSPIEGFALCFKICFWAGLVVTSPLWFYFLLQFITPALNPKEKKILFPFTMLSYLSLFFGFFVALNFTIPLANEYLYGFNSSMGVNMWSLNHYISYSLVLLLASGIVFELFIILLFLLHLGVVSVKWMIAKRRHAIVIAFILGALFTPPDVLSQFMMAFILIIFYELALLYGRLRIFLIT